ncbi:hypothetical protein ACFXJ5_33720 [Streptomyces sp. NPDC059373]
MLEFGIARQKPLFTFRNPYLLSVAWATGARNRWIAGFVRTASELTGARARIA